MCAFRQDHGEKPACVKACPAEAILVGSPEEISVTLRNRYGAEAFNTNTTRMAGKPVK